MKGNLCGRCVAFPNDAQGIVAACILSKPGRDKYGGQNGSMRGA